jgi:uncharacterized membrane protein
MKNCKSILRQMGFVLIFMVAAAGSDAPTLTFKFTTANVPGALQTSSVGVSNSGVIVGQYQDKNQTYHGFMLKSKKVTTIDDPNGTDTFCSNITPDGPIAIVGQYTNFSGNLVGFLYEKGKFTDIPGPTGATSSAAFGINDAGDIVGYYDDSNGSHGFLLKGNQYTPLDVPGATFTFALGINGRGDIVLSWENSSGVTESSLYNGKVYKTINVPGAADSFAEDLNNEGDIVYGWFDSTNKRHGALRHSGKYYKFNDPKGTQTFGSGINDRHLIVGEYQAKGNGPSMGFKATYK